ncbi:MAG: hypothetical protein FJY97_11475 [candidate division Zixibacteria bacterium]|nr:hypothetical protein [candidate division Zixibacteria bacterium]
MNALRTGDALFRFGSGGFVEYAAIGDKTVVERKAGFRSIVAADGFVPANPSERFPVRGERMAVYFQVEHVETPKGVVVQASGKASDMTMEVRLDAHPEPDGAVCVAGRFVVRGKGWVAGMGLAFPLVLDPDPLRRRTTVGGERRNETWRLDQNDEDDSETWKHKVSDTRARWPLWRIGGLTVDAPHHYLVWKANATTTAALPMDQGTRCPGWIEYANRTAGIRVTWPDIHRHAPAGFTMDGETGTLTIWLHPPSIRPLRCEGEIVRTGAWRLSINGDQDL